MGLFGPGSSISRLGSGAERTAAQKTIEDIGRPLEAELQDTRGEYFVLQAAGMLFASQVRANQGAEPVRSMEESLARARQIMDAFQDTPSTDMRILEAKASAVYEQFQQAASQGVQYSCSTCLSLVRTLRAKGADVTVYIQAPETASAVGSFLQKGRIERRRLDMINELADLYSPEKFHLIQYRAPASISGVLIDRSFLGIGWYTYRHIDETNRHNVVSGDHVQLLAHNVPAVLTRAGTPEFDILYNFFTSMSDNFNTNGQKIALH
jgi:hypothetical protein